MIDGVYFLTVVAALAVGTLAIRGSFIAFSSRMAVSDRIKRLFSYIPAAIFPALIVPTTFFHQGAVEFLAGKERFLILMVAAIAGHFVRNTLFVIALGLGLLFLMTQV